MPPRGSEPRKPFPHKDNIGRLQVKRLATLSLQMPLQIQMILLLALALAPNYGHVFQIRLRVITASITASRAVTGRSNAIRPGRATAPVTNTK